MREASSLRVVWDDPVPEVQPVSRRSELRRGTSGVRHLSRSDTQVMGSRSTDPAVHQYRQAKIETRGALGLEVASGPPSTLGFHAMPVTPSLTTSDAVGRTFDGAKAFDGLVCSFDGPRTETSLSTLTSGLRHCLSYLDHPITPTTRYDPARFDAVSRVTSRYDATRLNAPTPPDLPQYDTSPVVTRFNTPPAPQFDHDPTPTPYLARPVVRHDSSPTVSRYNPTQIRAPEPYANTETNKDADALSSLLSEARPPTRPMRMDVEVVRGKVAETSLHPFPFSRPHTSHGSSSRPGPSPPSHRSGPSPTFN
ncbi:hypothetical protein RhiJN_25861 [Ceratobasidium sp. AG-Ba]|nr:hypothetical protein RhiJN_25861 [Ceratobasidium sp. AG-Ba]